MTATSNGLTLAHVAPGFPPRLGGIEVHVAELAARSARSGYRVEVLTQDARRSATVEHTLDGATIRRFPSRVPSSTYPFAPSLFGYLNANVGRYALIHAHNYHSLPALAAAMAGGPPLVFTPQYIGRGHSRLAALFHRVYRPAGRYIVERTAAVICVSSSEAAALSAVLPQVAERVTVIPNGVNRDAFSSAQPFSVPRRVVLAVARLERYKGVARIVEAVARLGPDFSLVVAGDGPQRRDLERLAFRLGLGQRARFVGRVDQATLARWYQTAAVYVTMSPREGLPIALIEAIAAQVPVVAVNTPVHAEALERAGWDCSRLVDIDAPVDAVATAIERVGSVDADSHVPPRVTTWDEVWQRTQAVYETVLNARA